jgi:hypothetical protein
MDMRWIILLLLALLPSCNKSEKKDVEVIVNIPTPEIDMSTPDKTVKSLLTYNQWMLMMDNKASEEIYNQFGDKNLIFYNKTPADSLQRRKENHINALNTQINNFNVKILEVDIQSASRAIVQTAMGKQTMGIDFEKKEIIQYYTLTQVKNNWIIENINYTCSFCDGTGKKIDYGKASRFNSFKKCDYCNGDGLKELFFPE